MICLAKTAWIFSQGLWAVFLLGLGGCLGNVPSSQCQAGVCPDQAETAPDGQINIPYDYLTVATNTSIDFPGQPSCPAQFSPCRYSWVMGGKQISTNQNALGVHFAQTGFYTLTYIVTDSRGIADPTPAQAHIVVWNGTFQDDFNRPQIDWDTRGWRRPILETDTPMYSLLSGWLHVTGDYNLPGSTAIMAGPQVQNTHIEVTMRRFDVQTGEHYADIIVRMHPSRRQGSFYRIRFWQEMTPEAGVEIAIFKISDAANEHGILLNDPSQPPQNSPTICHNCPYRAAYPLNKNFRIIVENNGNQFQVRIYEPDNMTTPFLQNTISDTLNAPYLYEGEVGLTHYEGISDFDDFLLRKL